MFQYFIFALFLATFGSSNEVSAEQRFIGEIEGPYANYSGQPLVDLGGRYYYFEATQKFNWDDAFLFCRTMNLLLVSIEDQLENDLIKTHLLINYGAVGFWTSGSDYSDEGSFVWTSTGKPFTFTDWQPGEPNDSNGGEDYVAFQFDLDLFRWNDYRAINNLYAICEEI